MCLVEEGKLGEERCSLFKGGSGDCFASRIKIKWKEGKGLVHFDRVRTRIGNCTMGRRVMRQTQDCRCARRTSSNCGWKTCDIP